MQTLGTIGVVAYLLIAVAFAAYVRLKEPSMSFGAALAGALLWPLIEIAQTVVRIIKRG